MILFRSELTGARALPLGSGQVLHQQPSRSLLSLVTPMLSHFFSPRLNMECETALLPNLAFEFKRELNVAGLLTPICV